MIIQASFFNVFPPKFNPEISEIFAADEDVLDALLKTIWVVELQLK